MKERFRIGSTHKVIPNIIPGWMANCRVEVISWEEFRDGELASNAKYHWRLDDIRKAVFGRLVDGKHAGKVSMFSPADFQ